MPKPKKVLKIIGGVIIFFTLPSLLFFAFLYFKYNEDLPDGIQVNEADVLATRMLNTLNHDAYKATDYIEFTFKKRHHFKWNKTENKCQVYWKNIMVDLDLSNHDNSEVFISEAPYNGEDLHDYIHTAEGYFNNDTFWLVAPYKVFDTGVERRLVKTKAGKNALLVTYTSGGSTPGDSYLWHFDNTGKPKSFQMWVDILPIDGLEASWSDWTTTSTDAQLPTFHKLLFLGLEIEDIKTSKSNYQQTNVKCETEEFKIDQSGFENLTKIVKTCEFGKFVSISTGNPNYQGKYYYDYQLFKKKDEVLIPIKNSDVFNSEIIFIEEMINDESEAHYDYLKKNLEFKECVDKIKLKYYSIDDMSITFDELNEISFHINYNLSSSCDNVNGSVHSLKLENIESFFRVMDFINDKKNAIF